ncbi:MAG TPA: hypothetical protein VMC08_11265 [Bacteroidales bacterium]|nr:hypothetical protein [Bacteroidales bacterium]
MKKITFILAFCLLATFMVNAQETQAPGYKPHSYYVIAWNNTFTIGDFNKWVGNASPAGFYFGGQYFIPGMNLSAGFNISWQRLSQEYPKQTYMANNGIAVTATNYRFTWMVPFNASIEYNIIPDKVVSPYIGLNIGGDYMEHHLLIQEYDIIKDVWDFSLSPEIGANFKFGYFSNWGAQLAFNYKWTTNQIEVYGTKSKDLQMLNLRVGLVYYLR